MNQEITNNPFNPLTPPKVFDEIKVSLASPERFHRHSFLLRFASLSHDNIHDSVLLLNNYISNPMH